MRKNYTFTAEVPTNRNEFIDMVESRTTVIVVNNEILEDLTKDVNNSLINKKAGKLGWLSIPMLFLSTNPVGWICSGIVGLCGLWAKASDDLKNYVAFNGIDTCNKPILVLHRKNTIDPKFDSVVYPDFVKAIDYKKTNQKVKNSSNNHSEQASSTNNKYECQIYVNTREEGGRNTPFFNNYMPQFRFDKFEATGIITLPKDMEMCMPGNTVSVVVEFKTSSRINSGDQFEVVEGTKKDIRIVGVGVVIDIAE